MADDPTVDNGELTDYKVSADQDGSNAYVQRMKLAYSADGVATHVPADASGLLVNMGANEVIVSDGGNTITVDGTVAVTHAALTELGTAIDTEMQVDVVGALPAGDNNIGNVDIVSSALPSGASTSANQTTLIGHVDGLEALLTTIDADTSNLSVIGGGTEAAALRVTVANNSTGLISVDDNGSTLSVDDGAGSLTVDNNGTFVSQENGAALTALQLIDDTVATTASAIPAKGIAAAGTDGTNARILKTDSSGELQVDVLTMPTTTVSGTVTANPQRTATATVTSVNDAASTTSLLASTAGRLGASFFNDSTESLYLKFGATASLTSFTVKLDPGGYFEAPQPVYTGAIDGIWSANAAGAVRITELT